MAGVKISARHEREKCKCEKVDELYGASHKPRKNVTGEIRRVCDTTSVERDSFLCVTVTCFLFDFFT